MLVENSVYLFLQPSSEVITSKFSIQANVNADTGASDELFGGQLMTNPLLD
jgi:hypothetical protein